MIGRMLPNLAFNNSALKNIVNPVKLKHKKVFGRLLISTLKVAQFVNYSSCNSPAAIIIPRIPAARPKLSKESRILKHRNSGKGNEGINFVVILKFIFAQE
jgi:hypothetical protein